jgi:Fanconi anemia group M protein
MMITVDSRESRSGVREWLTKLGYETDVAELAAGDYAVADRLLVERKEANDFCASVMSGRLFGQAGRLVAHSAQCVIVVEGDLRAIWSSINQESVAGALSAILTTFKIPVVTVAAAEQTARLIGRMARHCTEGLGYEIPLRVQKPKAHGAIAQYLVEGLPGVGPETSRRLLEHFKTPAAIFSATVDELRKVKGVGPKTAELIVETLQRPVDELRSTKTANSA